MNGSLHLASVSGQLVDLIARHGLVAIFALMAVDALLPVGGELTMLYGGVLAAGVVAGADLSLLGLHPQAGIESYLAVVAAGVLGSLLGALAGWLLGRRGGHALLERHGRWLHLPPTRVAKAQRWFDRFGDRAVLLGRLTPLVRSFISVPAGVFGSPLGSYTALTIVASTIWCAVFAGLGWALGDQWEQVHHAFRFADYAVVLALLAGGGWLLLRARRRRRRPAAAAGAGR